MLKNVLLKQQKQQIEYSFSIFNCQRLMDLTEKTLDTVFFQSSRIKTIGVIKINYPRMSHFPSSEAPCPTTEKLNIFLNEQRKGKDYENFFCFLQKLSEKRDEFEKSRKKMD